MRSSLILLTLLAVTSPARGQTRAQARAFVEEAADFARKNPREVFLAEVNDPGGRFHFQAGRHHDLYLFVYDLRGRVLGHGARRDLVGINRWNARDPDGRTWVQAWTRLVVAQGKGWTRYRELNPAEHNQVMDKISWVERCGDMVLGAGVYE